MFQFLLFYIRKIYRKQIGWYQIHQPIKTDTLDIAVLQLQHSIDKLHKQYNTYMKNTFQYYDTVRFVTFDMIYSVYKDIKKTLPSREFDYIILMGIQAYVSEKTLGSTFIYRDDTFQNELNMLLLNFLDLWENEKQELVSMDFDTPRPWESTFKKAKYNKAIRVSAVFSTYITTGYYVKNTLQFFNCLISIHERSKCTQTLLLTLPIINALNIVIEETRKRMIISENALLKSIQQLQYKLHYKRLKWGFYSFTNYDICKLLTDPVNLNRVEYNKDKLAVRLYPKSVIDTARVEYKSNTSPRTKFRNSIHIPMKTSRNVTSQLITGSLSLSCDLIPVACNIKSSLHIIQELVEYCITFAKYSKQQNQNTYSINDVQTRLETAHHEHENKHRLVHMFLNFIDLFLPFATVRKTYDLISNLSSINSEHSQVTLLIVHKWNNIDVLKEHENINLSYLLSGCIDDIAYKIIKMNLTYFDSASLEMSYFEYNTR